MTELKAPRKTDYDRINELVGWYERFKPEAGKRIPVEIGPKKLAKAISFTFQKDEKGKPKIVKEFPFRGRTLIAVGVDAKP